MAISYHCRHCGTTIGEVEDDRLLDSHKLGLQELTESERAEMVHYGNNGNTYVKVTCEHCQEALERDPSLHAIERWIN
ncbi:anti-sigma-F factor Fin [Thalassorhabdus alkalitolerans]|uniref:Anti-sigma-F factor Fin n=1 Tax=Thalassorhabdus alkalitolerans TaxID=2282697 RepID=A0ABW0YTE5_9BACI|nr:anti-sigma-F factor Fin family protein [Thalassobacillus sp. C254]